LPAAHEPAGDYPGDGGVRPALRAKNLGERHPVLFRWQTLGKAVWKTGGKIGRFGGGDRVPDERNENGV